MEVFGLLFWGAWLGVQDLASRAFQERREAIEVATWEPVFSCLRGFWNSCATWVGAKASFDLGVPAFIQALCVGLVWIRGVHG